MNLLRDQLVRDHGLAFKAARRRRGARHVDDDIVMVHRLDRCPFPFGHVGEIAIEQRDELKRVVSFSLYHFGDHKFLWRDLVLPEKWWVNLAGVSNELIGLKVFESTENPDKTSFLFLNVQDGSVVANIRFVR